MEASFEAADYELPPRRGRRSRRRSTPPRARPPSTRRPPAAARRARPAVETIRLTPAHASPRSSVASDTTRPLPSIAASVAHRGAPTVNVRTTSCFLNDKGAAELGAGTGADAARRAALGRRARLAQVDPRGRRRRRTRRDALLCDSLDNDNDLEPSEAGALRRAVVGDDACPRRRRCGAGAPRRTNRRRVAADADECRVPRLPERRVPARLVDAARLPASAAFGAAPPSSRPGSAVS